MKTFVLIILFFVILIWAMGPHIQLKPFRLSFDNWLNVLAVLFIVIGIIIVRQDAYDKGFEESYKQTIAAIDEVVAQVEAEIKAEIKQLRNDEAQKLPNDEAQTEVK